jgi:DNA-binding NarL/FixJ family response regulator
VHDRLPSVSAASAMTVKTIVVDDHAIVRRGIVQIVAEHPEVTVVAEAGDYGQLRNALRQFPDVDLLVMDIGLPGKNGIDILKTLREEMPRVKVLIVSMYPEDQYAVRAFRAGASGYLNKASAPEKLVEAISQVIAGRKYVTPEIAQALIENLNAPQEAAPHDKLSDREFQTLRLIASGKRLSDIATELALSPKTVSVYRARILEKMGMSNNAELTHYAIKHGLVE